MEPLLEIINASIKTEIFPSCLKQSVVKPIFKNGPTQVVDNYRPISLVPALWKMSEKIISKQLSFFEKHNIFNLSQFGFRKNKFTKDAIASILDNVIESLDDKLFSH
jgi:hypothetical protein